MLENQRVEAEDLLCKYRNVVSEQVTHASAISLELHLEMHLDIYPNDDIYGRSIGVCATDH